MRQWLARDGLPLRMLSPFGERTHFGGASARAHDSRFQIGLGPLAHRIRNARLVAMRPENAFDRGPMMRRVGMKPYPTIFGAIVAGDRIPRRRHSPTDRTQRTLEPDRAQAAVYRDGGAATPRLSDQLRDRQARYSHCRAREVGDGKDRWQAARSREDDLVGGVCRAADSLPRKLREVTRKFRHLKFSCRRDSILSKASFAML